MLVGTTRWTFRLRGVRSLKDKRRIASRIRDRVRAKFHVAISEVEAMDDKRRLVMGLATVGNDAVVLRSTLDRIASYVDGLYLAEPISRPVVIAPFDADDFDWSVDVSTL
jgi:uncharacterized protein YlxP (DUF503 family)